MNLKCCKAVKHFERHKILSNKITFLSFYDFFLRKIKSININYDSSSGYKGGLTEKNLIFGDIEQFLVQWLLDF